MRTVSFKLPEQLDDALSDMARRRNSSRSAPRSRGLGSASGR
ncbi:MAG: ribbon-helix-helix protein, CopG family [Gemmatimonadaceae bacterium]